MSLSRSHQNFVFIWLSTFISSAGTFLFLISLSTHVLIDSGSAFQSSLLFGAQWLTPALGAPLFLKAVSRYSAKRLLVFADSFNVPISLILGAIAGKLFPAMIAVLVIRGILESLTKSSRMVVLKSSVDPAHIERAASWVNTGYYFGIGVGTLLVPFLVYRISIWEIAVWDALSFAGAAFFTSLVRPITEFSSRPVPGTWTNFMAALQRNHLEGYFWRLFGVVGLFQGFHNVARTYYPVKVLQIGVTGVTSVQLAMTGGILIASLLVGLYLNRPESATRYLRSSIAATVTLFLLLSLIHNPLFSILIYFLFAVFFEVAFLLSMNRITVDSEPVDLPLIMAYLQPALSLGMVFVIITASWMLDHSSWLITTTALTLAGSFLCLKQRAKT